MESLRQPLELGVQSLIVDPRQSNGTRGMIDQFTPHLRTVNGELGADSRRKLLEKIGMYDVQVGILDSSNIVNAQEVIEGFLPQPSNGNNGHGTQRIVGLTKALEIIHGEPNPNNYARTDGHVVPFTDIGENKHILVTASADPSKVGHPKQHLIGLAKVNPESEKGYDFYTPLGLEEGGREVEEIVRGRLNSNVISALVTSNPEKFTLEKGKGKDKTKWYRKSVHTLFRTVREKSTPPDLIRSETELKGHKEHNIRFEELPLPVKSGTLLTKAWGEITKKLGDVIKSPKVSAIGVEEFQSYRNEIGNIRSNYLKNVLKWKFPGHDSSTISPDLSDYDNRSTHIVFSGEINGADLVLSALRIVHPERYSGNDALDLLSLGYQERVKLMKKMSIMATNELDTGKDKSLPGTLEQITRSDEAFLAVARNYIRNKLVTIERLVVKDTTDSTIFPDKTEGLIPRRIKPGHISMALITPTMAYMATEMMRNHIDIALIQTDTRFLIQLLKMYGEGAIVEIACVIQENAVGEPDPCHTILLDINKAYEYIKVHNRDYFDFVKRLK